MNLNYVGSLQERFAKVRSSLASTEEASDNLFNAISIYVPKSLAKSNLEASAYSDDAVTADKYATLTVTVDNYKDIFTASGNLYAQWLPIFNDDTNIDVILYIVVFDDSGFKPETTKNSISWKPLTKAFNELYFISCFKTLFSEHYDGSKSGGDLVPAYDDSHYFDMALCLSELCEQENTLSVDITEVHVAIPEKPTSESDNNACHILTNSVAEEREVATNGFLSTAESTRANKFWGFLDFLGGKHTMVIVHNGAYLLPVVLAKWFEAKNSSGEYVGNKLAKIRLTNKIVKPTGNPSPLNGNINLNLDRNYYTLLDEKSVGYFMSIADGTENNAQLKTDRSISNFPVTAYLMSKWIDYQTSKEIAKFMSAQETLTKPALTNNATYLDIQSFLINNLQKFSDIGRLRDIERKFPPFSEVKKGQTLQGTGVWKAIYVDDIEGVDISGAIEF